MQMVSKSTSEKCQKVFSDKNKKDNLHELSFSGKNKYVLKRCLLIFLTRMFLVSPRNHH